MASGVLLYVQVIACVCVSVGVLHVWWYCLNSVTVVFFVLFFILWQDTFGQDSYDRLAFVVLYRNIYKCIIVNSLPLPKNFKAQIA